ncbi:MAG: hypothetical protein ACW96M_02610, partial [Candidatus Thorarchaeota archaeon]
SWPYFIANPLPDFFEHFPLQWWMTMIGLLLIGILTGTAYRIWKWEFDRREKRAKIVREAEARGELII